MKDLRDMKAWPARVCAWSQSTVYARCPGQVMGLLVVVLLVIFLAIAVILLLLGRKVGQHLIDSLFPFAQAGN
jgi:hypothetical protein